MKHPRKSMSLMGMFHDSICLNVQDLSAHINPGSGVGWEFSILLTADRSYRKYSPNPDFMLLPSRKVSANERWGFCPILLGEVVSCVNESDRWRMLLQLAVCARVNGLVTKANDSPLVIQAVYFSKQYHAERYLAYADTRGLVGHTSDSRQACSR